MLLAGAKLPGTRLMGRKRKSRKKPSEREQRGNPDYWPETTNPKGYRYYFHPKHHTAGNPTVSRWKPDVSRSEEFQIFEIAVRLDLADEDGNLYNVRKGPHGAILELGVYHEQIARFWKPSARQRRGTAIRSGRSTRPGRAIAPDRKTVPASRCSTS